MKPSLLFILNNHGVIAYPTETVFGIGCNPNSNIALNKINSIKQRDENKGFIIVSNNIEHLQQYTRFDLSLLKQPKRATTYIVPCKKQFIGLLTGNKNSIAIRLSNHPQIADICNLLNHAVVSTSLNLSGKPAITCNSDAKKQFEEALDFVVAGECGGQQPSQIINAVSLKTIRQ